MKISRREALGTIGGLLAGSVFSSVSAASPTSVIEPDTYWTPHKLNSAEAAKTAYENFFYKEYGCCYGAFKGIVGLMGQKYGSPYNAFPLYMMEVGKSGISEWGTICGALLGIASAWALFWGRKERDPMVDELFTWYEQTPLPGYIPEKYIAFQGALPSSVPDSVLCHVSVSKWCYENNIKMKSKPRSERCARVTGAVTLRAVEIMNAKIDHAAFTSGVIGEARKTCGSCHAAEAESDILKGKMDCKACHSGILEDKFNNHP
ncbi:MAG: C-GCAxxG-C-C family protein [Thermodesulfobacteriota bacterium]|nr:C-GCAxxG-C-C family protein [Thermodesulfobacteriota bacterium]